MPHQKTKIIDAESEEFVRAHLAVRPRASQRELRELLLRERGVEIDESSFVKWAWQKGLTRGHHGLRAFTRAQVKQAIDDAAAPLNEVQRIYLAARKGISTEPLDQKEAARLAGLPQSSSVRYFERVALERLRSYFAEGTGHKRPDREGASARDEGPPLGISSTEVAAALQRARAAGMRLTERQERVVRGLWGVEGEAQLRPVDLARELGVHRHTVRDTGWRALVALRRGGHLSGSLVPEKERRAPTLPGARAGLSYEDVAALVECFLCEDGPGAVAKRSLPAISGAEILRLAYGLEVPAHRTRPPLRDVAAELGFTSDVNFKRAYAGAIESLLHVAGLGGRGPEEAMARIEEKAAQRLRRSWKDAGGPEPEDDPLPFGARQSPNPLRGLGRKAVEFALAKPYGLLSRRERYVLALRAGLFPDAPCGPPGGVKTDSVPTQGEVAERMGVSRHYAGRLESQAALKLGELLGANAREPSGRVADLSDGADDSADENGRLA